MAIKELNVDIKEMCIQKFGKNFNTIDNLKTLLKEKYHPQFFSSMQEFIKTPYFAIKEDMSIDEYTDDYITESENYIIILFDDYRDFENAKVKDKVSGDFVISYNKETRKITKYFYTSGFGFKIKSLKDIEIFYNN